MSLSLLPPAGIDIAEWALFSTVVERLTSGQDVSLEVLEMARKTAIKANMPETQIAIEDFILDKLGIARTLPKITINVPVATEKPAKGQSLWPLLGLGAVMGGAVYFTRKPARAKRKRT